jgi:hypothetical protein
VIPEGVPILGRVEVDFHTTDYTYKVGITHTLEKILKNVLHFKI